jgi:hypothetical protein
MNTDSRYWQRRRWSSPQRRRERRDAQRLRRIAAVASICTDFFSGRRSAHLDLSALIKGVVTRDDAVVREALIRNVAALDGLVHRTDVVFVQKDKAWFIGESVDPWGYTDGVVLLARIRRCDDVLVRRGTIPHKRWTWTTEREWVSMDHKVDEVDVADCGQPVSCLACLAAT